MNANDRRVRKTRIALQKGLASLMMKKDISQITIKELTDYADIHRATFYTHYLDIYDLYDQIESMILDDFAALIVEDSTNSYEEVLESVVTYIYEHKEVCNMFLSNRGKQSFRQRMSKMLEQEYLKTWQYEMKQSIPKEHGEFLISYHIQGCLSIISMWAQNNYIDSRDKILEIIKIVDINFDRLLF